jgi:hypothetical protein
MIITHIASASFDPREIAVRREFRGISYSGRTVGRRETSLFLHLARRVVVDEQWIEGTTADQYVDDLRGAVAAPSARLTHFRRRGGTLAGTLTPTADVLATERRGPESLPYLLVIYSADHGMIVTEYQVSGIEHAAIPEDSTWVD